MKEDSRDEVIGKLEALLNRILERGKLLDSDRDELEKIIIIMLRNEFLDERNDIVEYILDNIREALYEKGSAPEEDSP